MTRTNFATVLFITAFVSVFTLASPINPITTLGVDVALAQQSQVAQDQPKEAIPAALPSSSETPEKFKPLLGKWKHDDVLRQASWEITWIGENGDKVQIAYTQGTRPLPVLAATVKLEGNILVLEFSAPGVQWKLKYYDIFGGMFDGTLTQSGYAPMNTKAYRTK